MHLAILTCPGETHSTVTHSKINCNITTCHFIYLLSVRLSVYALIIHLLTYYVNRYLHIFLKKIFRREKGLFDHVSDVLPSSEASATDTVKKNRQMIIADHLPVVYYCL